MAAKWKDKLKELLTFSKGERIGVAILLLVVLTVLTYPLIVKGRREAPPQSFGDFTEQVDAFEAAKAKDSTAAKTNSARVTQLPAPFSFDPNTADSVIFLQLGFSPKQTKSILLYRTKGGWFSRPQDFSKLYVVSEEQYKRLLPYITVKSAARPLPKVELNSADTTELQRLRGIGSYYANQIVAYRQCLGGFYCTEQLMEIKGIDKERFSLFTNQISIDEKRLVLLPINTASELQLKQHPYIGAQRAKRIIALRAKSPIQSLEQLVSEHIFTDEQAEKLSPYLQFE